MTGFVNLFSPISKWTLHSVVVVILLVLMNIDSVLCTSYTNQVAVHIEGGPEAAHVIAKRHGFINLGQIGFLEDHYLFEHPHIVKRSTSASREHGDKLEAEPQVRWFEQQVVLSRKKRAFVETPYTMTDPNWGDQWYLDRTKHMDMNVIPAWLKGYSGKGIVVTILDDGIERNHTDLVENYDPEASYDINGRDADPFPRYDYTNENRHGTRCAGEVSASANNSMCGVGVAFRSRIGGVRMLDGDVTDAVEAAALSLNPQHIDIYSASWGPDDDGKVVDGPGKLAKQSFLNGITKGRNGKGSIFVWASGNGGNAHDSCNCDGYTNSIFTLSVSSTSELGNKPWYLEECSSTLATTYSSGGYRQRQIVTTDLHNLCTKTHTGTSAAAPLAAGIVALVLEANPDLTWRDVQFITMLTARTDPFIDADFIVNSMGRKVSLKYGYGLMDTSAMVDMAESWTNVPEQHTCEKPAEQTNVPLTGTPYSATIEADGCAGEGNAIKFVEHVQINVTLSYSRRGDISLHLTSPRGTISTLLPQRQSDRYTGAFQNWPFMSVHFWGEDPTGTWKLEIKNEGATTNHGSLTAWSLRLHGTATDPLAHTSVITTQTAKTTKQPTICHSECDGECNGNKPEDCVKCKHYRIGDHGACTAVCPNSSFANEASRECVKCDSTCHTCRGSSGTECNSCFGGWFLMTKNSTCVMECPDGFYEEDPSGRCSHCAQNCLTCQGTANTCTSCEAGEQLQNGACYGEGTCLQSQFQNAEGLCETCHITCETCSGGTLHDCTSCVRDTSLTTYLEENMCVQECNPSYYLTPVNQLQQQSCQRCDSSCLNCTGPTPSDCLSCEPGLTLTNGQCLSGNPIITCAPGQYMNTGQCLDCHATCLTCKGATHTDCLSCSEGSTMGSGECTSGCVTGTYPVTTDQPRVGKITVCAACHGSCASCHGPKETDCITCRPPLQVQGNLCTPKTCPDKQYLDLVKHTCEPCHFTCDTCKGAGVSDCLTCSSSYLIDGGCVPNCPGGFYPSVESVCQPCMGNCEQCTGPGSTSCQKCLEGFEPGVMGCIRKCDIGKFYNGRIRDCSPCSTGCDTCLGEHSHNCLSCVAPLLHEPTSHRCLSCCSSQSTTDCCTCRPGQTTGECVLTHPHPVDNQPEKVAVNKDQDSQISGNFAGLIIGFCLLPVIVSVILFGILQLRSQHKLCWRHNYSKVPMTFDPVSDKISSAVLSFGDDNDDDEELFINSKNMDPNHNKQLSREEY